MHTLPTMMPKKYFIGKRKASLNLLFYILISRSILLLEHFSSHRIFISYLPIFRVVILACERHMLYVRI